MTLEGKKGLMLYDEELMIDLDSIAVLIQEHPEVLQVRCHGAAT